MGRFLLSLSLVGVSACAELTGNELGCRVGLAACPEVVTGNELYVSVETNAGEAAAMEKAEAHCGRFGRLARLNKVDRGRAYTYFCVRRDQ